MFGKFSPCIFYDHAPANAVTMPGMVVMVVASSAASLFVLVHTLLTLPNFFQTIKAIMFTGPVIMLQMAFPNIFAVSAYENGYTNKPDYSGLNATEYATATAGLTPNQIAGITQSDFEGIRLHTLFFIGWMTAVTLGGSPLFALSLAPNCLPRPAAHLALSL